MRTAKKSVLRDHLPSTLDRKPFSVKNITHISRLRKYAPGSKVPELLDAAQKQINEHLEKIDQDSTKTTSAKMLNAYNSADTILKRVLPAIDVERKTAYAKQQAFEVKIQNSLEVKGTTDLLIRQQQLQLIKDMNFADILALIRQGDIETAKCLQLPLGKSVVLKGTGRAEAYQEAAEQAILGSDGYKTYQLAQEIVSALEGMGSGLVGKIGEFSDKAREIGSTIVDEVA